jgi:hypothetical protein
MRSAYSTDVFCIVCGDKLSEARTRVRAITCTKEHAKQRSNALRRLLDLKKCRYCARPSTPEERASFKQWKKWVREQAAANGGPVEIEAEEPETEDSEDGE